MFFDVTRSRIKPMIIRSDNANRYTNEAAHTDENVRES
jgi:hypothetical protein